MTFGPVTIVRPGASVVVAAMGAQGLPGTPGAPGTPGTVGPAPFSGLQAWASGQTYKPGPPADYVAAPVGSAYYGNSFVCGTLHTSQSFDADVAKGVWLQNTWRGATGAAGTPGSTWYSGSGFPSGAIGTNGDYFFRTDTYDVLIKVTGNWAAVANLKGLAGNTVNSGQGAPVAAIGANGDFYIDVAAFVIYGPKVNGTWPASGQSMIGPRGAGTGNLNGPTTATTPGNVMLWGKDNQNAVDGGRLGFIIVDTPQSPYTSVNRDEVWWATASAAAVQILPANPVAGNRVKSVRSGANTVTVQGNGNTIAGVAADLVIDQDKVGVELVWDVALATWSVLLFQHA